MVCLAICITCCNLPGLTLLCFPVRVFSPTTTQLSFSLFHRALNTSQLQALGIEMMPGYKDPYSGRVLTRGEIGCFLSHHSIWTRVRAAKCIVLIWGKKSHILNRLMVEDPAAAQTQHALVSFHSLSLVCISIITLRCTMYIR